MAVCDANDFLDRSRCFDCMTMEQKMAVQLAISCAIMQKVNPMTTCDVNELLDSARCFMCLTPEQMMAVNLQLNCEILNAGVTGGKSCVICADTDPVDDPDCSCALGYNRSTGSLWYWNDASTAWVQLIGG